jgi:hypothetical protein
VIWGIFRGSWRLFFSMNFWDFKFFLFLLFFKNHSSSYFARHSKKFKLMILFKMFYKTNNFNHFYDLKHFRRPEFFLFNKLFKSQTLCLFQHFLRIAHPRIS